MGFRKEVVINMKRISFNKYFAEHLRGIIKNRDFEENCFECQVIIKRLDKFLSETKT